MRKSIIAKGTVYGRAQVRRGERVKTPGGLKKADLMLNKRGRTVSKKKSALGVRAFRHIARWTLAVAMARKALNLKGFVLVNDRNAQGRALYAKTLQ